MARKETRYGPNGEYVRRKILNPITGKYQAVYGTTVAEREEKISALQAAWASQQEDEASPYVWQYAAAWYARVSPGMTKARAAAIAREINNNICPVIGDRRLKDLTSDDVMDVMAARSRLSRSAQEKTLQTLSRILQAAENAGKLSRNPARGLRPGGAPAKQKTPLTRAQQAVLLAAVAGKPVELFIRLALYTGLRREEICGLAWKDVHLDPPAHIDVCQACRWINNNRPEISPVLKSAAAFRTVPVPPPLLPSLQAARAAAIPEGAQEPPDARTVISAADGTPWTYQAFRRAWSAVEARTARTVIRYVRDPETGERKPVEAVLALGDAVPRHPDVKITIDFPVTPHLLRHTYITELVLGGVNVKRVQYLAGHETAGVTMDIYAHYMGHRPEELAADAARVFPAEDYPQNIPGPAPEGG